MSASPPSEESARHCGNGRVVAFDALRCLAFCGIVGVHVCYSFPDATLRHAGQQLGTTFNAVFLVLSALLFGTRKWTAARSPMRFLFRRILRLAVPLWIFLAAFFAIIGFWTPIRLPPAKVAAEFAFLGWPVKLPGVGHLWFVTLISLCYLLIAILDRLPRLIDSVWKETFAGTTAIALSLFLDRHSIPAVQAPLYLFAFGFVWNHASEILPSFRRACSGPASLLFLTFAFLTVQFGCTAAFQSGLWERSQTGAYVLGFFSGLSWIGYFVAVLERHPLPRWLSRVLFLASSVSFEVYLVHNPLARGPFFLHELVPLATPVVRYPAVLAASIALAIPLHLGSEIVLAFVRRRTKRDP